MKNLMLLTIPLLLVSAAANTEEAVMPQDKPLIPREVLFGNPERSSVRISPHGDYISFLAPRDGVLNVWFAPADAPDQARPLTNERQRGIRSYFWALTGDRIVYLQDNGGDENWHVYTVTLDNMAVRDLTPGKDIQARLTAVSRRFPEEIIIGLNDRDPRLHDLYRFNVLTGQKELLLENDGFVGYSLDDNYVVRYGMRLLPDGSAEWLERTEDGDWEPFISVPMADNLSTGIAGFDEEENAVFLTDSRDRDTSVLKRINLDTGETEVLAEDPKADLSDWMQHPEKKHAEAVAFTYEKKEWRVLDSAIRGDFDYLRRIEDGEFEVLNRSLDDMKWIVAFTRDDGPVRYYLYERRPRNARFLFTNKPDLEGQPLQPMHPVVIAARDGLPLVSYLTLPPGSAGTRDDRPKQPLPMVLHVHGGPWARVGWGYNAIHQWLANRGYAVLDVNFRGSTGFGKKFLNAGNREWGGDMHDDLIDAVRWAVDEGIAAEDKVAIMGGSYGGYATLVGLTFTPEVFACGVDIVGVANIITLLESIPPYWEPQVAQFAERVGDFRTDEGREFLRERSPISRVDAIQKPLLIGHGANDPRVKQAESDQIVEAMQEKDLPVTYVVFSDEGHGFARPENRLAFYAITEAFLAEHLGGRREAIGDAFEGSTVDVRTGAEATPGVSEALAEK